MAPTIDPKQERAALDKLINVCRAARAGRDLEIVPAFAKIEAELIARRDALVVEQVDAAA